MGLEEERCKVVMPLIDLTGKRVGRLVVVGVHDKIGKAIRWECKCDCGNTTYVRVAHLSGNGRKTKSCGCFFRDFIKNKKYPFKDIRGMRFGRLIVLERIGHSKDNCISWKCKCDCGKEKIISGGALKKGLTKSCGCLGVETSIRNGKNNLDNLTGKRFGKLLVLKFIDGIHYECRCDCGNVVNYTRESLREGTKDCGCVEFEKMKQDLIGKKYGRLTIISYSHQSVHGYVWNCLCECGKVVKQRARVLQKGHTVSCGCYCREIHRKTRGEKHPCWNPKLTPEERTGNRKRNLNPNYYSWYKSVYERDKYVCQICGYDKGGILVSHHKNCWSNFKNLRYDIDNGVTLCVPCHKKFHGKYGYRNNTLEQWLEFEKAEKGVLLCQM